MNPQSSSRRVAISQRRFKSSTVAGRHVVAAAHRLGSRQSSPRCRVQGRLHEIRALTGIRTVLLWATRRAMLGRNSQVRTGDRCWPTLVNHALVGMRRVSMPVRYSFRPDPRIGRLLRNSRGRRGLTCARSRTPTRYFSHDDQLRISACILDLLDASHRLAQPSFAILFGVRHG
jgi:hypothetical protein